MNIECDKKKSILKISSKNNNNIEYVKNQLIGF